MQDNQDELSELVEVLHRTYQRINELTGNTADSVFHFESGTSYLLPDIQGELQRMETVQRQHASERAAILNALPAHVALLDHSGRILAVNDAWRSLAEKSSEAGPEETVGQNYLDICESATGADASWAGDAAAGIRSVLNRWRSRYTQEYSWHSAGEECWSLLIVTALDRDGQSGAVVMHVDVTDRHQAHQKADELRRRLERLVDQAKVGILVHRNFKPILVNRELARLLGYDSPDDVLALGDSRALFAEEEHARITNYSEARSDGREAPALYKVKGKRRDGSVVIMDNRAFTIEWGNETAVCVMLSDMTAQLEIEEQLRQAQRLEAIGHLTGGVAHDFNNLLTVILGNAELLADSLSGNDDLRQMSEMIVKTAERGAQLTNRLLAFARRQALESESIDINGLIGEMDELLRRTLGGSIEIQLALNENVALALVDPGQLENAILNLCINARDAMPEGGRIVLETANASAADVMGRVQDTKAEGSFVMVAVEDAGTGMDEAALKRVFEPFFTTKAVGEGSGLGLSMVYGFVRQSNGFVNIASTPGEGTRVELYLPQSESDAQGETRTAIAAVDSAGEETILLVEDDAAVRDYVCRQLQSLGYEVLMASGGLEALEILKRSRNVDLLFTDIIMPGGMNGRELAREVSAKYPQLPILFTSGHAAGVPGREEISSEFLLQKPYRRQELAEMLRSVLGQAKSRT
ncbi:PAS domain S-box protein [Fodinicurvata fenggangensis]|uniref:PAS domain S-box protein n=1 Tax=Fodinicurvata fenggangensis TaxID=1121830 RepID=UPI000A6C70CF|nr:PAS domain S-box protein [Fodinicurvata fenggangensis]